MATARDLTIPRILAMKGEEAIAMVTAYDATTARLLNEAGVDILLVGDSLGMVILGHETTLEVTMDDMVHHTRAVARGSTRALVVADMPYMSYHVTTEEAVRNAGRLVKTAGAEAVKIEGGARRAALVDALVGAEVPVMGHIGLTPQSFHRMGGFKVQGRSEEAARQLVADARALESAGAFSIVLEGMPAQVGAEVTAAVAIPTIGIGAGPGCDGQVLVVHDILGLGGPVAPRFVRRYAEFGRDTVKAVSRFVADVKSHAYPSDDECYAYTVEPGR